MLTDACTISGLDDGLWSLPTSRAQTKQMITQHGCMCLSDCIKAKSSPDTYCVVGDATHCTSDRPNLKCKDVDDSAGVPGLSEGEYHCDKCGASVDYDPSNDCSKYARNGVCDEIRFGGRGCAADRDRADCSR